MGEGTSSKRKVHEGQEYDYVFDIDIEDGKPPLKLPYNLRESAWDAARKFLEKNELPMSYYEQVANWIAENTKAATFSQDYPSTSNTRPCRLPQKKFTTIVEGQPENAVRIIAQSNGELLSSGKITVDQALRSDEVDAIKDLAHKVNKQDPRPTERQTTALLKVASHWPRTGRVPAIGLLARLAVSADFVSQTSAGDNTIVETLAAAGLLAPQQETPNTVVHAIRLLVNLFATTPGRIVAEKSFDKILELVRPFAKQPESSHQSRALASLYLNHAVSLTTSGDESVRQARGKTLIVDIATLIDCRSPHAPSAAPGFTLLAALGTLLSLGTEFKGLVKDGIKGTLEDARQNPAFQEPKVREVLWEIRDLLA
jgi:phospholipase A-2-activating protein